MDGFLDESNGGCTELRIHGVSGTPPESMLEHPHPRQVTGDKMAGFYRRWWPGGQPTGKDADHKDRFRREAYSWGGLTSGSASRALWLLLLPFMLVNVAFYGTPRTPVEDGGSRLRRASARVQRLLALTLTGTLVLSAIGLAMDLVGWQCGRPQAGCGDRHGWLGFLAWRWADEPAQQLVLTSLLPAAIVALLWYLSRKTWTAHEMTEVPGRGRPDPEQRGKAVLLENRATWNGGEPVGRLRDAHVTAGFSLVGALLLAPLASHSWLARAMLGLHLAVIAGATAVLLSSKLAWRKDPGTAPPSRWRTDIVPLLAAALYLVTAVLVFAVHPDPGRPPAGGLPWFTGAVIWTFVVQAALLLVLLALTLAIGAATRRRARAAGTPPSVWAAANGSGGQALADGWGLAGLVTPVLAMSGWLLAGGFAAGLALRAADYLGAPVTGGQAGPPGSALTVPAPYFWGAGLSLAILAVAAVGVLYLALRWRVLRHRKLQQLDPEHRPHGRPSPPRPLSVEQRARANRLKSIAGTWARAALSDEAGQVAGWLFAAIAVLVIACCAAYGALGSSWLAERASWLVTAGSFAIGTGALGLVAVGRSAYRNPGLRRTVGIAWDFGTFWPRATHPLAPPCYTERVIPELLKRISWLAPGGDHVVVISAHSQGSVIAAALVLQLEPEQRRRVRLLTYGSPLQRTYARYFPAYFGPLVLRRIGELLPAGRPRDQETATGATWPWRNLFRPSDPIGGAIFYAYAVGDTDNGDVDWQLMDPLIDRLPGDSAWPRTYGHSDYFQDPAFAAARTRLQEWQVAEAAPEDPADRGLAPPAADATPPAADAAPPDEQAEMSEPSTS